MDGHRNDAVVFPGRVIDSSGISLIFHTEQTLWIRACLSISGCGDGLRIFFRLGQIDGNINVAVFGMYFPFLIFAYPIAANVVAVLT